MNKRQHLLNSPSFLFYGFLALHLILWTFIPFFTRFNLPMDSIEGTIWGHQLEWGYDKNPFLNGWLTAFAVHLGGSSGWMIYLFSQLSVTISFWAVWQLGKKMQLPASLTLLAILLLEGIQYYNLHAIDFNDNTLEIGLWSLIILFFYQSITHNQLKDWLLTGLFAGLALMAKYYSGILLLSLSLFLLTTPSYRHHLYNRFLYAGLCLTLLISMPHLIWLTHHDFSTVHYMFNRLDNHNVPWSRFLFPLQFFTQQGEAFLPAGLLCLFLLYRTPSLKQPLLFSTQQRFLLFAGIGPFVITLLLSLVFGITLRAGWGQPLMTLWPFILLTFYSPSFSSRRLHSFAILFSSFSSLLIVSYAAALLLAKSPSSANYPGKIIAESLTEEWRQHYHLPLSYVAGSRFLAGTVAFYSKDRPTTYINADPQLSPWINEADFIKKGGIWLIDPNDRFQIDWPKAAARFHALRKIEIRHFLWRRNPHEPPVEISVAFLPPHEALPQHHPQLATL